MQSNSAKSWPLSKIPYNGIRSPHIRIPSPRHYRVYLRVTWSCLMVYEPPLIPNANSIRSRLLNIPRQRKNIFRASHGNSQLFTIHLTIHLGGGRVKERNCQIAWAFSQPYSERLSEMTIALKEDASKFTLRRRLDQCFRAEDIAFECLLHSRRSDDENIRWFGRRAQFYYILRELSSTLECDQKAVVSHPHDSWTLHDFVIRKKWKVARELVSSNRSFFAHTGKTFSDILLLTVGSPISTIATPSVTFPQQTTSKTAQRCPTREKSNFVDIRFQGNAQLWVPLCQDHKRQVFTAHLQKLDNLISWTVRCIRSKVWLLHFTTWELPTPEVSRSRSLFGRRLPYTNRKSNPILPILLTWHLLMKEKKNQMPP